MFSPLSSFTSTSPVSSWSPRLVSARAVLVMTGAPPGSELDRARAIADANDARPCVLRASGELSKEALDLGVSARSDDRSAALVVVGPHPRSRSRRFLAERGHDVARCPVLQVRNRAERSYDEVIIATTRDPPSSR